MLKQSCLRGDKGRPSNNRQLECEHHNNHLFDYPCDAFDPARSIYCFRFNSSKSNAACVFCFLRPDSFNARPRLSRMSFDKLQPLSTALFSNSAFSAGEANTLSGTTFLFCERIFFSDDFRRGFRGQTDRVGFGDSESPPVSDPGGFRLFV